MTLLRACLCLALIAISPAFATQKQVPGETGTVPCAQMGPLARYSMVTVPVQNAAELRRGQFVDIVFLRNGKQSILLRTVEVEYIDDGPVPQHVTFNVNDTEGQKLRLIALEGKLLALSSDCIPHQG